jgi:hypothetical protein
MFGFLILKKNHYDLAKNRSFEVGKTFLKILKIARVSKLFTKTTQKVPFFVKNFDVVMCRVAFTFYVLILL